MLSVQSSTFISFSGSLENFAPAKHFKDKPDNREDVKDDQLLGLLLGEPGAGKIFS